MEFTFFPFRLEFDAGNGYNQALKIQISTEFAYSVQNEAFFFFCLKRVVDVISLSFRTSRY